MLNSRFITSRNVFRTIRFRKFTRKNTETPVETSTSITHKTKEEVKILNEENSEKVPSGNGFFLLLILASLLGFMEPISSKEVLKTKTATENVTIIPEPIPADSLSDAQKKIEFKGNSLQVVSDGLEDRMITF